ncbi:MAG: V-type ATP synthase subunit D [Myxococcales bacterium]|nr:V-type ATP synthase subunit D [Myxococcales bacterium]MDH3843336.1 V-type ATP synthase subunit D [Myxococcales bacterium]
MSVRSVAPTRSGLVRASARLGRVQKGRELLNRKREALISELFRSARPALDARKQVEDGANQAYAVLLHALAARGQAALQTYAWPKREIIVELEERRIWGIPVPTVVSHSRIRRTLGGRDTTAAAVGPAAARTAAEFEQLVELVLESLPKEQLVRRLGVALGKTTRQVNTLQLRVEPVLTAELHALRGMLEERERDERSRLRHVLRRIKASSITVSGGHQRA